MLGIGVILRGLTEFLCLQYLLRQGPGTDFNQTIRLNLGKKTWVRTFLGLHDYGDGRAWYFGTKRDVDILVAYPKDISLPWEVISNFSNKVQLILGKKTNVILKPQEFSEEVSEKQLQIVFSKLRKTVSSNQPYLLVVVVPDFTGKDNGLAKTYEEYGIIISANGLQKLVSDFPQSLPEYFYSTLLHEFGHQLGLEHNKDQSCLMFQKTTVTGKVSQQEADHPIVDFCPQEISVIKTLQTIYK